MKTKINKNMNIDIFCINTLFEGLTVPNEEKLRSFSS